MNADFVANAVVLDGLAASDKAAALTLVLEAAAHAKFVSKKAVPPLLERLREREKLGSTGIGNGVAIPHVKSEEVKSLCMVVARPAKPIDYDAIDGRPVQMIFLLLSPTPPTAEHLEALKWISSLARNTDFRRFFGAAKSLDELRELLREHCPKR